MCAIFGFIRHSRRPVSRLHVRRIVDGNLPRGRHAFGFAWIDEDGRLHSYRQAGSIERHWDILDRVVTNATMLIGHLRWATHGAAENNINNHPHPSDGGWIVHNGIIYEHEELLARARLLASSDCDSEALGLLIESQPGDSYAKRAAAVVNQIDRSSALAMLGLWKPGEMVVVRRGNPLCWSQDEQATWFSSLPAGMVDVGTVYWFPDATVQAFYASGRRGPMEHVRPHRGALRPMGLAYAGG